MARPKKNKIEAPSEQKEASKIVKNIKKTKSSKILLFAKNRATSIDLADDAAAIVLNADNTVQTPMLTKVLIFKAKMIEEITAKAYRFPSVLIKAFAELGCFIFIQPCFFIIYSLTYYSI